MPASVLRRQGLGPWTAWRQGRDTQLEKAVEIALKELEANPIPKHVKPAYPNYHKAKTPGKEKEQKL